MSLFSAVVSAAACTRLRPIASGGNLLRSVPSVSLIITVICSSSRWIGAPTTFQSCPVAISSVSMLDGGVGAGVANMPRGGSRFLVLTPGVRLVSVRPWEMSKGPVSFDTGLGGGFTHLSCLVSLC